jgi:dTDP-4-dehydrorhamnose reductase
VTRLLVLGGAGMLGHKLVQQLQTELEVYATVRGSAGQLEPYGFFDRKRIVEGVDAAAFDSVIRAVGAVKPDAIVNCIGVIKQLPTAKDPLISIEINSLFPHRLAALGRAAGVRVIHISTDCVFSGNRGMYKESDQSDAEDLYGRSKFLGEISGDGSLTLRTSIIGRELRGSTGLVEWFLAQRGNVHGYTRAIYTGLTTTELARVIKHVLQEHPSLSGLYQVASAPINKYDLLHLLRDAYGLDTKIEPFDAVKIDRSLDGSRFRSATDYRVPSWPEMVREMAAESTYIDWRTQRAS